MFLLSTKALAWFFLVLSILNIPIYVFYSQGDKKLDGTLLSSENAFSMLSLGNIGSNAHGCGNVNLKTSNSTFYFYCKTGKLGSLMDVGLAKKDAFTCSSAMQKASDFDTEIEETCHQEIQDQVSKLISNPSKTDYGNQIDEEFNTQCTGKRECSFNIYNSKWALTSECTALINQRKAASSAVQPRLMAFASCEIDDIFNPYTGEIIRKNEFGFVVVCFDLLVCIAMFAFVYCLSNRQKKYVDEFKD